MEQKNNQEQQVAQWGSLILLFIISRGMFAIGPAVSSAMWGAIWLIAIGGAIFFASRALLNS